MNATHRIVCTPDGRQLRLLEAGQPDGVPVLVQRGTPQSCRLYDRWVEDAQSRGIRLICYERPGYGESTRHPRRSVASAANDVAEIAEILGLKRLLVWGISGGGPHALACAALLPGLVMAVAALGSIAPYPAEGLDYCAGMGEDNVADFKAALKGGEAHRQAVEASASKLLNADLKSLTQALQSLLCPGDAAALTTDFAGFVLHSVREGIGKTRNGMIDDDMAHLAPWGFELGQIRIPVLLMHGERDQFVPVSHSKWLARKIANAETRFLPEDGHLTVSLRRIPEVHDWLLSKM